MDKEVMVINDTEVVFEKRENGIFTDSVTIAKVFKKYKKDGVTLNKDAHSDVITVIEDIATEEDFSLGKISESKYVNSRNREYKMYLLDRDMFSLVVMGFSGKKALQWKRDYIRAFNKMEQGLREMQKLISTFLPDMEKFGELNEKNNLAKTKPVRGYFRTDKHDALSRLYGERRRLENRLGGLFDAEIQIQIDALDKEIDKVSSELKLIKG